ncbi:MAG: coproporphyrinogen dehydrogenase HemZ, partial [Lachnospiraceae bacterium]|nr:coproporphyrinogen dehydrogenase HemZ [Lachnospiraceae bacterium]
IYIGGGTPTTLSAEQLRELILHVKSCYPVSENCEFTVEAGRPDSITREKLMALREQGLDRISVNPQTMQQKTLDLIGRRHTVGETEEAFRLARELEFSNINMDLIIGLPGETVSDFQDTLNRIQALDPDSITIHSLVIKRASRLRSVLEEQAAAAGKSVEELERGRGEQMEQMLLLGEKFAMEHGYKPYYMYRQKNSAGHAGSTGQENIGFARPGSECLYNILIMEEKQTIVAVGAGASTKLYHSDLGQVSRVENVKSITDYIDRVEEMVNRKYHFLLQNE